MELSLEEALDIIIEIIACSVAIGLISFLLGNTMIIRALEILL